MTRVEEDVKESTARVEQIRENKEGKQGRKERDWEKEERDGK